MKDHLKVRPITMAVFFLMPFIVINSQTFEEFVKQREADFQHYKRQQEQLLKQMSQRYDEYVKKRDREFTEYLNQRWYEYQVFAGLRLEEKPKPLVIPEHDAMEILSPPISLPFRYPGEPPVSVETEHQIPVIQKTEPEKFPTKAASYDFYGNRVLLSFDPMMVVPIPKSITNSSISGFWAETSQTNYNYLINQLVDFRRKMNLNDWGYYLLIRYTARSLYPNSDNGYRLMTWFLLNRSGYKSRVAYSNNQVVLLLPSVNNIYEVKFQIFNGVKYYLFEGDADKIYTYDEDFPDATRILDMNIDSPMNLGNAIAARTIEFNYAGQSYNLSLKYCNNTVKFFKDYPLSQMQVYFNSAVSPVTKESLAETLIPLIEGKSELEAVNLLLNFTQTAFNYKTDLQQFGREKFFFVEEVLHYPYSDCEDRSVLFAYLVRELLNLRVLGIEYENHVATAVNFSDYQEGDYFVFMGDKYIICDPTYLNAPVGLSMPEFAKSTAQVFKLDNRQYYGNLRERIWQRIYSFGGYRAGNSQDLVFDEMGNAYATGFFKGTALFKESKLNSRDGSQGAFVAKFDNNGELVWVRQPENQENATAYHIAIDNFNNIYISGTYNNLVVFGDRQLKTKDYPDIFVAKYDAGGELLWAEKAGVSDFDRGLNFLFLITFDKTGTHISAELYKEDSYYNGYGIYFDNDGNIILAGSSYANIGLNLTTMTYETLRVFNPVSSLNDEHIKLIDKGYDPVIAGLFAAINLIKINNVTIPGTAVQEALDKYNPNFKNTAPTVYNSISRINFLKNEQGVVLITTDNRRSITIDYLRINNNASFKITEFSNGDAQIEILSGITVGKAIVWYNLNFIRLYKDTGDLLFDYANDNTQRIFNLKRDILY